MTPPYAGHCLCGDIRFELPDAAVRYETRPEDFRELFRLWRQRADPPRSE